MSRHLNRLAVQLTMNHRHTPVRPWTATTLAVSVAVACALPAMPVRSQNVPDSGQTLQELRRLPEPARPAPVLQLPTPSVDSALPGGVSVVIRSIRFGGNSVIDSAALSDALADALDQPHDMAGLRRLAERVGARYRESGYLFARAHLPPQDLRDGVLRIEVLEGRYGRILATSDDPSQAAQAQAFLATLESGAVIESTALEQATLILGDQPGVRITPVIQPGAQVGTGDLLVAVEREPALVGSAGLDNEGNRYSGRYRLQAGLDWRSPLRLGDQISVRAMSSDENLWLGSLAYSAPLGGRGLRMQLSHAHTRYELGDSFASADASGVAKVSGVGLSYPLLRTNESTYKLSANYLKKRLRDDRAGTSESKSSRSVPVAVDFTLRDGVGGGGMSFGSVGWTVGRLDLPQAGAASGAGNADGRFHKLNVDVLRAQNLSGPTTLFGRFSAQWANRNLDSSERISLGGAGGVRAYPSGEANGDQGWLMQVELRHAFGAFAPYAFVDAAAIRVDAAPSNAGTQNQRNLGGAGVGQRYRAGAWDLNTALAWRTHGGAPQAEPSTRNTRLWASLTRSI